MNLETVSAFLAAHHVVPIAAAVGFTWKVVRPFLLDLRAFLVHTLAIGRASAKRIGVTEEAIVAELPASEKAIPSIPDEGVAAKILGVVK